MTAPVDVFRLAAIAVLPCLLPVAARAQFTDLSAKSEAMLYLDTLEKALPKAEGVPERGDLVFLAETLGKVDRQKIEPQAFLDYVKGAVEVKTRFYQDMPEESFRRYVLAVRIREEFTTPELWRRQLSVEVEPLIAGQTEVEGAAKAILEWVRGRVKLMGDARAYPLSLKGDLDPITTLRGGHGSEIDVSILAVAALRSAGIASRIVYAPVIAGEQGGKVWVEWRGRDKWQTWAPSAPAGVDGKVWLRQQFVGKLGFVLADPPFPKNVTASYAPVGRLWMAPKPLTVERFEANAMIVSGGRLQPLMGRDIYNPEPEGSERGIGLQRYVIVAADQATTGGMKPVALEGTGWYQFDFGKDAQEFAVSGSKPGFFEWEGTPVGEEEGDAAW